MNGIEMKLTGSFRTAEISTVMFMKMVSSIITGFQDIR